MLPGRRVGVLGKIAVELDRALIERDRRGARGAQTARRIAAGDGWSVADVVCTSGPSDRAFEEQHSGTSIAVVLAGTFQYRGDHGRELMTPGSVMLGNCGARFECGHEHAPGDRCLSFHYSSELFDRLAADVGLITGDRRFRAGKLPPVRALSPLVARAALGVAGMTELAWEEFAIDLAAETLAVDAGRASVDRIPPASAIRRVTESVRMIERDPAARITLGRLARDAGQSPFHYLRIFERLTGVTPHQFILRMRLRNAAARLATEDARVIDIALDCGFNDISSFNRAFRAEFGLSPGGYRLQATRRQRASTPEIQTRCCTGP